MSSDKIIRSLCWFAETPSAAVLKSLDEAALRLMECGYEVQSRRVCFKKADIRVLDSWERDERVYISAGTLDAVRAEEQIRHFLKTPNIAFNLDLTSGISAADVDLLLHIVRKAPDKTFHFAYTFNNKPSSPFFPSATFGEPGFAVGLQETNLADGCATLEAWTAKMRSVWEEICRVFDGYPAFLGIDSSVAPLSNGRSSLVHFVKRIYGPFPRVVTTDLFVSLAQFLVEANPKPVGLCGIMLPCLEDFELADEYEAGQFSIERNLFLALHSGLGIDAYPMGTDEDPERVLEVLRLVRGLSVKYGKPLSVRFISDGKARIGDVTNFQNPYLKDVKVRPV